MTLPPLGDPASSERLVEATGSSVSLDHLGSRVDDSTTVEPIEGKEGKKAGISHEMKNLLNGYEGMIQSLAKQVMNLDAQERHFGFLNRLANDFKDTTEQLQSLWDYIGRQADSSILLTLARRRLSSRKDAAGEPQSSHRRG